ncbi:uncharacterized protein G6M90_00g055530 [Metarhizium brunneum]|uniref:DUF4470 domain-containing protein n=1 Tax=Metarhizium brunneum TaxID=500148 RepID=A0A7D5YU89_9HYPO|nr:hypothetical protein G6M90_00g055530 [Metarhizium brunneum]
MFIQGQSTFRHFIYTLLNIPKTAKPVLRLALNPTTPAHVCRDFFAIHLLFDRQHDPYLNAEALIHLWYSAKLPLALWRHIEVVMKRYYYDFDECFENAKRDQQSVCDDGVGYDVTYQMSWGGGQVKYVGNLFEHQWRLISKVLKPTEQMSTDQAAIVRVLDAEKSCEPLKVAASRMTPSRTAGLMKWRTDGLLLPFGHPTDGFDMPNPIFFQGDGCYPHGATAEPIAEWPMEFLDFQAGPLQNDVYGKLFYYLRDTLVRFQEESKRLSIMVGLTSVGMPMSLHRAPEPVMYDRIHMGDLWDFNPACNLTIAAGNLRHQDQNPFATMLAMCRLSVTNSDAGLQEEICGEGYQTFEPSSTILDDYAPPIKIEQGCETETVIRRRIGLLMWRNWDKFSERFMHDAKLFAFHLSTDSETDKETSVFKTGFLGMEYKDKNTITRRWPNRLVHSKSDEPSLRDFERHVGWFDTMPQRWLEWKRVADADDNEWEMARECVLESSWREMAEIQAKIIEEEAKSVDEQEDLEQRIRELLAEDAADREKSEKSAAAKTKAKASKRKKGKKK